MLSHLASLRVGEIATLTAGDVVNNEGQVRDKLRLLKWHMCLSSRFAGELPDCNVLDNLLRFPIVMIGGREVN